jgi:hypothetical protein
MPWKSGPGRTSSTEWGLGSPSLGLLRSAGGSWADFLPQPPHFGPAPPPAPPAPAQADPLHPAAFFGAAILCFGFVNAYPMPRLPAFPIILRLAVTAASPAPHARPLCDACAPAHLAPGHHHTTCAAPIPCVLAPLCCLLLAACTASTCSATAFAHPAITAPCVLLLKGTLAKQKIPRWWERGTVPA